MIRGQRDGKNFSTWFIGFDHELPVPTTKTPVHDKPVSRAASLETLLPSVREQQSDIPDAKKSKEFDSLRGRQLKETRDIYKEAFESARRAEGNKFKIKFDSLLSDLHEALAKQAPSGTSSFGSTSYGEVMMSFRSRMKELLLGFSQRLQLAYESFDVPHTAETTNQQVRLNVSKMVEDILGESLDLTSDEAVSDLSSLSDDSGAEQNSFEDQIAQAIVSKLLENHRREVSQALDRPHSRLSHNTLGNYDIDSGEDEEEASDIVKDFEELRNFVRGTQVRPTPLPRDFEERLSPIEETPIQKVNVDKDEAKEDFLVRCSSIDRVHNAEPPLPDFSEFDNIDFNSHEIDPDLLSMNLAIIPEETEEELEEDAKEVATKKQWRENWIFKGSISPYDNCGHRRVGKDLGKNLYMMVPKPEDEFVPQVGNRDADQLSDLSDTEDGKSIDEFSDDENTFYAKTSEELARISRKHSTTSVQTDSDLESLQNSKSLTGALKQRDSSSVELSRSNSLDSTKLVESVKWLEDLIPADGDDPKFVFPPESVTIAEGEPLKLSCRVAGTSPVDVFWYREQEDVEELEDSEDIEITTDGDRHNITMYNLQKSHSGQYMCIAVSALSKCTQYFIITVTKNKQEFKKPEFIKGIQDVEVTEGQSVKFRCKVKGYPQPRVIWYKDGKLMKSNRSCRLEKFGNRDYILTIDYATMDDDAEYCVMAKNVAGETKSSAQVIVEPLSFNEIKPTQNTPVSSAPHQTNSESVQQQEIKKFSSLSQKVTETRDNMVDVAEKMLGTAEEITYLNENLDEVDRELAVIESGLQSSSADEENNNLSLDTRIGDTSGLEAVEEYRSREKAAKGMRILTSNALNMLRTAEDIIQSEREDSHSESFVTSTPRSSVIHDMANNNSDTSSDCKDSSNHAGRDEKSIFGATSPDISKYRTSVNIPENDFSSTGTNSEAFKKRPLSSELSSDIPTSDLSSSCDLGDFSGNQKVVNFGCKSVDPKRYKRDYDVKEDEPQRKRWEVKMDSFSPRAEVVNRQNSTEEKIYMTAGKVYLLEDCVRDLESKVKSADDNSINGPQMSDLEDEVAKAVAQVAQSESEVHYIEKTVNHLHETPSSLPVSPRGDSHLSTPRLSIDSGVSSIRERPPPIILVGHTGEEEVPESRGEYDTDSGVELPSVNRLRAMFSNRKEDDFGDGSFKRKDVDDVIHSITARHVPKDQLNRLRNTEISPTAPLRTSQFHYTESHVVPAEQSPNQTSSSTLQFSFNETPQLKSTSSRVHAISAANHSVASPSSGSLHLSEPATYRDFEPGKDPVQIYPETEDSPRTPKILKPKIVSMKKPDRAPTPVPHSAPRQSFGKNNPHTDTENSFTPQTVETGARAEAAVSAEKKRGTPKIRSGCISARAAFWENRITRGSSSDNNVEDEFPEMVQE